jgi:hypothetical protein
MNFVNHFSAAIVECVMAPMVSTETDCSKKNATQNIKENDAGLILKGLYMTKSNKVAKSLNLRQVRSPEQHACPVLKIEQIAADIDQGFRIECSVNSGHFGLKIFTKLVINRNQQNKPKKALQ